ncbi:MAG: magnesium transporter [Gammaproteobacteria bacterium]|nr:magnesium transporter [Gammaproteobacteria bacterium]
MSEKQLSETLTTEQAITAPINEIIDDVSQAITINDTNKIVQLLKQLNHAEIADVMDALNSGERRQLIEHFPDGIDGEVLLHMGEGAAIELVEDMDADELQSATESMDTADVVELLDEVLPKEAAEELLESMDQQRRERIELNLRYAEDTAGRLMHTDAITVRADITIEVVQRYLRRRERVPEDTTVLMVIDRDGYYQGAITVLNLFLQPAEALIADVMEVHWRTLDPNLPEQEVARIFENHDWFSAPVVDDKGLFLGRIVVDDVIDTIRDEADRAMLAPVGLDEDEDLLAPMLPSAKRRTVWLAVNLVTAFLASWVIGLFEATLDKVVALAVLMPIVASMGGIAGSQTLTLTIRGLAMGQIAGSNTAWLLRKEMGIGLLNGLIWAVVVAVIAYFWFDSQMISLVIGAALVLNMLMAALAGILVPLTLNRMNIDPALSGAVVLTTVTDVVGFMAFLGLATIFLT